MRLLHLSADYPDPLAPAKTQAIRNLLALVPEFGHTVYSLNRASWTLGIAALDFDDAVGEGHRAVAYGAPPRGLLLATRLARLADWIAEDVARRDLRPTLIHAHKLSVEGLVARRLASRLGVPVVLSIQGDSDLKIVAARRDLRPVWSALWREAVAAFPFAPWAATRMAALLGPRAGPTRSLPCPAAAAETLRAPRIVGPVFRTVFHLGSWRRKNADGLFRAVGHAAAAVPDIALEVVGGGDPGAFARLSALGRQVAPGRIRFLGTRPNAAVGALLNGACALPLVSHRESFGMAFSEALLAGAPCLVPRGWGVDGYLEDGVATLSVPAGDPAAIADGLVRLAREEAGFKARLAALAEAGGLDFLRRDAIARTYREGLAAACAPQGAAA